MKKLTLTLLLLLIFLSDIPIPAHAADTGGVPDVGSETAVLMVADTGQVLYQKDMDKQMYPASITKIITGMLALENGNLTDTLTMSGSAVDAVERDSANIALSPGEQISMEQALYAISVASANDAANGIAENVGGSLDGFVAMMNEAAAEAGATNTHFDNANGLPDENHYTTAHDMARITAKALKVPGFIDIFGTSRYKIPPTNIQPETRIVNSSNRFLNGDIHYEGILISKTGWTQDAQHTLVTAAQRNGVTLIVVVMKSSDSTVKWSDTSALLDYGFDQFSPVTVTEDEILGALPDDLTVPGAEASEIDAATYAAEDVSVLLPKNETPADIRFSVGEALTAGGQVQIPVRLSLVPAASAGELPLDLLTTTVKAALRPVSAPAANAAAVAAESSGPGVLRVLLTVLLLIVGFLAAVFVLLLIRRAVIVRKRRRRRSASGHHHHHHHHRHRRY
ncbi:D-alanyl-D-alanine carboxypeptidase (penicillin-binding protein 5/6) [Sporobacter termitidis DSM 10068]|uniref:D-alanyl-D-alanine carboxypeptidase (Penicillin-binding protein 5/6) n=1 Tax=Sporobacter termitidis DSM 10068 TaxID=1123282 RepID=A0A1M5YYF6_9FIRM|nr:D-alanyl-D-alanine carboxypeptidase family protein [Sporobacter termitidis]SHI17047.1 D-alanyl-D-alanine carboxypeptidase (penicillin-binding protein 5/6) [Sporobacter termitidis DSM 10068]